VQGTGGQRRKSPVDSQSAGNGAVIPSGNKNFFTSFNHLELNGGEIPRFARNDGAEGFFVFAIP
jgi:hypothetical protein